MAHKLFKPGSTLIRRDIWFEKTWTAWPCRVLQDDGETLTTAMWPGLKGLSPSTWVESNLTGNRAIREQGIEDLAARNWTVAPWTWQSNICLRQVVRDRWFAVTAFFNADDHAFFGWYIDFERPPNRTELGNDTRDLFLDANVSTDYSVEWKDQREYERAISLGLVDEGEREAIKQARDEAIELVRSRTLIQGAWDEWRLDTSWPRPCLPDTDLA